MSGYAEKQKTEIARLRKQRETLMSACCRALHAFRVAAADHYGEEKEFFCDEYMALERAIRKAEKEQP